MLSKICRLQNSFSKSSLHSKETFFSCQCHIFRFFEFMLLGNSSTAPFFHTIKKINNLKTFTLTIESVSAVSLSSMRPRCFNNIILHLIEIKIRNAAVSQNYSCKFLPFIHRDGGIFSVGVRQKTMETVD